MILAGSILIGSVVGLAEERAFEGEIDLSEWNPGKDGPVRLDGEWAFFSQELLESDDPRLQAPSSFATVPATWKGSHGFATYHLRVGLPAGSHRLAVRLLTFSTAYRLFANGRLIAEVGQVATDSSTAKAGYRPLVAELETSDQEALELLLQVSNYHYAKGGAWEPIWLGTPASVHSLRENSVALSLFLVGCFVIIGLYHLVLWMARRSDASPLFFSIVCFAMSVRILLVDEIYLATVAPWLPWSVQVKLEYLSILLIAIAAAPFMRALFPEEVPRWTTPTAVLPGMVMALAILLTPPAVFSRGVQLLQLYLVCVSILMPALLLRAVIHRQRGAKLLVLGAFALTIAGIYDTLLSTYRDFPGIEFFGAAVYLLPFALFVFVLTHAVVLSMRFARTFVELEQRTAELHEAHAELDTYAQELEDRVTVRTSELEVANRKLGEQASSDGLTGVGNRRLFDHELGRAWAARHRSGTPLSLVMCDVDHFKRFNDSYGHVAGDETLRAVASTLARTLNRPFDLVARYGGEEFVALLPETDSAGARKVAERILHRVASLEIPHRTSGVAPVVTVSIGVATAIPSEESGPRELVESADAALYKAKESGRNRMEIA